MNSKLRYFLHWLFPKWLYAFSTKVRIPRSREDFRKMLLAKYVLQGGGTAIDVGAHVGYHTRYLAEIVGDRGMVWAFEPNPYVFSLLNKYASKSATINARQKAVSNRSSCSVDFYLTPYSLEQDSTLELNRKGGTHRKFSVKTIALDDLLLEGLKDLKLIKIDVEGHEKKVLEGAQKVIEKFRPCIVFEYCSKEQENPLICMSKLNYVCYDLDALRLLDPTMKTDLIDVLAFPKEKEEEMKPFISCLKLFV